MRWAFVFVILYLIPLTILFKNYKGFKRACVYGSIYIVLSTVIVISNMYLSGFEIIEQALNYDKDIALETYLQNNENNISINDNVKDIDLNKINNFKKEIYAIEKMALIPMRQCVIYTKETQKDLYSITEVRSDIVYAKEMCEIVVKKYNDIKVPTLSKEDYTVCLDKARIKVKNTYELRLLAMENSLKLLETKSPIYINKITECLREADKEIGSFEQEIEQLKIKINESDL